jgi:hypothetical protein
MIQIYFYGNNFLPDFFNFVAELWIIRASFPCKSEDAKNIINHANLVLYLVYVWFQFWSSQN